MTEQVVIHVLLMVIDEKLYLPIIISSPFLYLMSEIIALGNPLSLGTVFMASLSGVGVPVES